MAKKNGKLMAPAPPEDMSECNQMFAFHAAIIDYFPDENAKVHEKNKLQ